MFMGEGLREGVCLCVNLSREILVVSVRNLKRFFV